MDDGQAEDMPQGEDGELGAESKIDNDDTASILNSLTPEQLKAVRSYAESFLDDNKESGEEKESLENAGIDGLSESFIFTKKQLRELNERLGDSHLSDEKKKFAKKEKKAKKKSPFNSPKFN